MQCFRVVRREISHVYKEKSAHEWDIYVKSGIFTKKHCITNLSLAAQHDN